MNTLCIYHANCLDGFTAAWVLKKAIPEIEIHPGIYGESPPDVTNKNVYLVDFSYKRPILIDMASKAKNITIIDHHKSALEDLVDLPDNVLTHFDMNHSGAILAWNYFFNEEAPLPLQYIEDRDLWKFKLPYSREINAALFSYPYDLDLWDSLMYGSINKLINEGASINRKHHKDIDELLEVMTRVLQIGSHEIPAVNLPYTYGSDSAGKLCEDQPFAAYYYHTPNGVFFGLRSDKNGVDVSNIAKLYGGGGHMHAAGFTVSFEEARGFEIA